MNTSQQGASLVEVLVALLLLSVAVLGFAALQVKAVTASIDAGNTIQATNLARDLAERIRTNRDGYTVFDDVDGYQNTISTTAQCDSASCSASDMALYDFVQVSNKAEQLGMQIAIPDCQGSDLQRKCIYVSWGETTPTNGTSSANSSTNNNCTNGTAYVVGAKCIILEAYNYE